MSQVMPVPPRWDMSVVYPSLDSPEFEKAFGAVVASIGGLEKVFDRFGVEAGEKIDYSAGLLEAFDATVSAFNQTLDELRTIGTYIHSFVTTDSRNNLAQAKQSELQTNTVKISKLETRLVAWIGRLPIEQLEQNSDTAKTLSFPLRKWKIQSEKMMSPAEESLVAELAPSSTTAWGRLHGNVSSQLEITVEMGGELKKLPMSAVRNLAYDADRSVRESAYKAELAGWRSVEVPLAASMNSIKGAVNVVARRRKWESPLDAAVFNANIDRDTLTAMLDAAKDSYPDFRRYFRAKAKALGLPKLAWYDLFAPLSAEDREWPYPEATEFVAEQFGTYSAKMGDFAKRAFTENWIDAEPRVGKRDGAFCSGLRKDESRILMNYKPSYGSVSTLAHELGHGYHNLCLADRKPLESQTPMTLAETASIFCETIVRKAAQKTVGPAESLAILEASLQGMSQVVVDISSRFLFESRTFDKRNQRELSASELCETMLEAQKETYGDGLDESQMHPYMWAMKPHYYSTASFYNFPYMFGLLFGLGLYAQYEKDPDGFRSGYDELLSSTGLHDAATLGRRFGIDIQSKSFWASSLSIIRQDIDLFEKLVSA